MSFLAILTIATYAVLAVMWVGLIYVLVVQGIAEYRRSHREPVPYSPLLTYGQMRRQRVRRALHRAGYERVP